jgi:hypothetical protein
MAAKGCRVEERPVLAAGCCLVFDESSMDFEDEFSLEAWNKQNVGAPRSRGWVLKERRKKRMPASEPRPRLVESFLDS